jgi:hypothetical protein
MKPANTGQEKPVDFCVAERPRYFPRQLITPTDLTLEAEYFRNKLRRHNRLMHGWGVVCGALVCLVPDAAGNGYEPWKVVVKPGYILGPHGDEIVIDNPRIIDLRTMCVTGTGGDPCGQPVDPWCSEVLVTRQTGSLYVAVKYKEIMTRPVRVQPVGCCCDDTQCEYSRWCDGYEICILTQKCPDSPVNPPDYKDLMQALVLECPACPTDPWVYLAEVVVDEAGVVSKIDNCSCRRIVISYGPFGGKCQTALLKVDQPQSPYKVSPGDSGVAVKFTGENFKEGLTVNLGPGIVIDTASIKVVDSKTMQFTINVASDAPTGSSTLTVTNPDCSMASLSDALIVSPKT